MNNGGCLSEDGDRDRTAGRFELNIELAVLVVTVSGDGCTTEPSTTGGSINEVGWRFQTFGINDLELVDQTGVEPVTS